MADTTQQMRDDPVVQFCAFTENKVGRFYDIVNLLETHNVHVVAASGLDSVDYGVIRLIVDDPERARLLFQEHLIPHNEVKILGVELNASSDFKELLKIMVQIEANIHNVFSFFHRPHDKIGIALNLDDAECAAQVIEQHGYKILHQRDITR
jgi:hypothetical protein